MLSRLAEEIETLRLDVTELSERIERLEESTSQEPEADEYP